MLPAARILQALRPSAAKSASVSPATEPLYVACVFERLPQVMPKLPEWETEYYQWQQQFAARRFKTVPKELIDPKNTGDESGAGAEGSWQPAPIETAADRAGDRRTTHRRLDQRIFFLVHRSGEWEFPHVMVGEGETTRAAAERALKEAIGEGGFQPYFVGNAPAGHVAVPVGAGTVFFHRCQLIQGKAALHAEARWKDFAWAAKDELGEYIKDGATLEVLQKML